MGAAQTEPPKEVKGNRRKYCVVVGHFLLFSDIFAPLTSTAVSFTLHQGERHLFSIAQKQNSTPEFYCQLTELADFVYLPDKSATETDSDDPRANDLARRRSNKRSKTKSIQKAAERDRGRTPKRLSRRLRDRSALDSRFSFGCGAGVCLSRRACGAPRNERSEFWGLAGEPTCIRQAHVRVPKGNFTRESGRIAQDYILPLLSLK